VASARITLESLQFDGEDLYWLESQPASGGRSILMRQRIPITPQGYGVRSLCHEYGGGAYLVEGGTVYFSNLEDQRVYRQEPGSAPSPITPVGKARYADYRLTPNRGLLVCIRELHRPGVEPLNEIVAIPSDGSGAARTIIAGSDFYSTPRISPDGNYLAWLSWDHPQMPWDGTELWVGELARDGSIHNAQHVVGGPSESIFQPEWSPRGVLHWVSDRTGWWNLYSEAGAVAVMEAEFGRPQWSFGLSTYAFLADGRIVASFSRDGTECLAVIDNHQVRVVEMPYTSLTPPQVVCSGQSVAFIGASATEPPSVLTLDLDTNAIEVHRRSFDGRLAAEYASRPRAVSFPTDGEREAHAIFYPPANPQFSHPPAERPPLIVMSHGGPTSKAPGGFVPEIAFWTSRGFAVADINYGGSTGYGREYREHLKGQLGIVDTADCLNAARWLVQQGEVDGDRLVIRGASAGGYTTLCALTFHNLFHAGASYFGIADCEAFVRETHKFEKRYFDGLLGPWPECKNVYRSRSPVHFADQLSCPVILFQGLDDKVVPPTQAEAFVRALENRRLPHAYIAFEGEQHGFRRSDTIRTALEAELYFYSRVFGFEIAESVRQIPIANFPLIAGRTAPTN
jgi:dipeptidyl aminopeptidase/acylaminoacyl peptidase